MTAPSIPWQDDPIATPPSMESPRARAWPVDVKRTGLGRRGCEAMWLIEAPHAHPFWHSYILSLVTLGPIDGVPPAIIRLPGATHELVLQALSPDHPRQAVLDLGATNVLTPINFAAQLVEENEGEARARMDEAVRLVVYNRLNPDTDYVAQWIWLFGDNMIKKAANDQG